MIFNATLLRLDPAESDDPGPDVHVRCAFTPLSNEQGRAARELEVSAQWVVYIPLAHVPSPAPAVDGHALLRADGGDPSLFRITQVIPCLGRTLRYIEMYLAPT